MEKHLEHQNELLHKFIDFKKEFAHVWYDSLWRVLKEYIDNRLIEVIRSLYDEATNAVLLNMEVWKISFERQWGYGNEVHYLQYYLM